MSHNIQDFDLHAGDKKTLRFTVYEPLASDPKKPDTTKPIDLTGATIRWGLSKTPGDAAALFIKTTGGGGIAITDETGGEFQVTLDKADTVALAAGLYYHEAEVVEVAGDDSTIATGTVTIDATVLD